MATLTLEEIAARSGDSKLLDHRFEGGKLTFSLDLDDLDATGTFTVPTTALRVWESGPKGHPSRTCRLELVRLETAVPSEKGRWVAPSDRAEFMKHCRTGLSLAYGLSNKEAGWLLRLVGSNPLLACVLAEPGEVRFELEDA